MMFEIESGECTKCTQTCKKKSSGDTTIQDHLN